MSRDFLRVLLLVNLLEYLVEGTRGDSKLRRFIHGKRNEDTLTGYDKECNYHGYLRPSGCHCHDHWTGDACQYSPEAEHCNYHCGEHGTCTRKQTHHGNEYWYCNCNHGWTGNNCDTRLIDPTSTKTTTTTKPVILVGYDKECNFQGYLKPSGCHCHNHWTGDTCQFPPDFGNVEHCSNHCGEHGICTKHHSDGHEYWFCKCSHGWHGMSCTIQYIETNAKHCFNTYCVNGGCAYLQDIDGHHWKIHCKCDNGWGGSHCEIKVTSSNSSSTTESTAAPSTSTTSKTTTTATTTSSTTTTFPPKTTKQTTLPPASATSADIATSSAVHTSLTSTPKTSTALTLSTCNHVDTLSAIAQQTSVSNQNAYECSPGFHTSHEALVLTDCSVSQSPSLWKQGVHVMSGCSSTNAIPNYTPIAAFDNGQFSSRGSLSGIFLGCTSDGFKMAVQNCGQTPYIAELHIGGVYTENPNSYYTIW